MHHERQTRGKFFLIVGQLTESVEYLIVGRDYSWSLAAISRNAARIAEKIGRVVAGRSIQILDGGSRDMDLRRVVRQSVHSFRKVFS